MKLQKKVKMELDDVNSGLKINRVPSANVALASVLARWFDAIINSRRLVPNSKGEYIFAVLRSEFERNINRNDIPRGLRDALKDYGYKLKLQKREVIVIKFR